MPRSKTVVFVTSWQATRKQAVDKDKNPRQNLCSFGRFLSRWRMIIGYARVSTDDQNLDAQTDALKAAGAERIFADKISGVKRDRPKLGAMLDQLRPGDVVVVAKYDRLARSLRDLLDLVETIKDRGAGFRSLAEDIDTTTPAGRLVFHVFASIAQFERERIAERTKEGLEAAKARGRIGGRPPALTSDQKAEVRRMRDDEHRHVSEIARLFKVSERTVRRA
jgi:DNA invertase Pin-like site-specific DNA recombinase